MPRKLPSAKARALHRLQIATHDLIEAEQFIRAAQEIEAKSVNPGADIGYKALICAAVIYYARPFSGNEHPNPNKRPVAAADSRVDIEPLRRWISDPGRRRLHRDLMRLRNKIVAHAESRYFDVKMVRRPLPEWSSAIDYDFAFTRTYPSPDLKKVHLNLMDLLTACSFQAHAIAPDVRREKRLRRTVR